MDRLQLHSLPEQPQNRVQGRNRESTKQFPVDVDIQYVYGRQHCDFPGQIAWTLGQIALILEPSQSRRSHEKSANSAFAF